MNKVKKGESGKLRLLVRSGNHRNVLDSEPVSGKQQIRKTIAAAYHALCDEGAKVVWHDGSEELIADIVAERDEKDSSH